LSAIILSTLFLIGVIVVNTHTSFNPAILNEDTLLPAVKTIGQSAPPSPIESFTPLPPELQPMTDAETFGRENLSDKINGKAELYLSAGFTGLVSQRFSDKVTPDLWVEVFVYDMGSGQNAFAVFSAQRRENSESLDLTPHAYRSPNAVFLVHGQYYLELIAARAEKGIIQNMESLAATFIGNTRTESITITEQNLFPEQNLIADSIALIASDAFGFDRLKEIYTAEYVVNDEPLMAYLSRRKTPEEARELAAAYGEFLTRFGGYKMEVPFPVKNSQAIEILDTYEIVFSFGPYLAGVREATNRDQAIELAIQLLDKIKEGHGEP
jgi:hypothetical protein